jgi:outer membrane protein OmpA-like peptidoglycan-associated protein
MVFVFIILLMYFAYRITNTSEPMVPISELQATRNQLDSATNQIKVLTDELARAKQNPLEKYLKDADATRENILRELQSSIKAVGGVGENDVRILSDQGILRLAGDMLFPKGRSSILPNSPSDNAVRALALALSRVLPCFSLGPESNPQKQCNPNAVFIDAVFIEGHTDNVPITGFVEGNISDNLNLSARRATNTVQLIYAHQPRLLDMYSISPSQEERSLGDGDSPLINPAAFGETRPAFSNDTDEGRKANRRIDVRVLMYSPRTDNLNRILKLVEP